VATADDLDKLAGAVALSQLLLEAQDGATAEDYINTLAPALGALYPGKAIDDALLSATISLSLLVLFMANSTVTAMEPNATHREVRLYLRMLAQVFDAQRPVND
jgi:hypothetical protein